MYLAPKMAEIPQETPNSSAPFQDHQPSDNNSSSQQLPNTTESRTDSATDTIDSSQLDALKNLSLNPHDEQDQPSNEEAVDRFVALSRFNLAQIDDESDDNYAENMAIERAKRKGKLQLT